MIKRFVSEGRRFLWALGAVVVLGGGGYLLATRVFPLELARLKGSYELRAAGVERVSLSWKGSSLKASALKRDHCEESSACTCIVLIHGLADDATTWRKILLEPKGSWWKGVYFLAVDLPGNGDSAEPPDTADFRASRLASALVDALRAARPACERWVAVGNSWGGSIALWSAIEAPGLVTRLVLASPGGVYPPAEGDATLSARDLLKSGTVEAFKEFQRRAYFRPRELPEYVWQAVARRAKSSSATARVTDAQTLEDLPGRRLKEVVAPALILWGEADRITPIEQGRRLAQDLPVSVFREIKECGHLPQKECPKEIVGAINDLLRVGVL